MASVGSSVSQQCLFGTCRVILARRRLLAGVSHNEAIPASFRTLYTVNSGMPLGIPQLAQANRYTPRTLSVPECISVHASTSSLAPPAVLRR